MMNGVAKLLIKNNTTEGAKAVTHHSRSSKSRGHCIKQPLIQLSSRRTRVIRKGKRRTNLERSSRCDHLETMNGNLSGVVNNQGDLKQSVEVHTSSLDLFDSLDAVTVESDGYLEGSDNGEEDGRIGKIDRSGESSTLRRSSVRGSDKHNTDTNHSHRKNGTTKKCLPPSLHSPSCLSVKLGTYIPDEAILPQSYLEGEQTLFWSIANRGHSDSNVIDEQGDAGSFIEESVVVCPFRHLGACVKGQHTQRELFSNCTTFSHLLSLAGLVHELRTEQRVTQDELQKLQLKVDAQQKIIERYKRIFAQGFPSELPSSPTSSFSACAAQQKGHRQTKTMVSDSHSILKSGTVEQNTAVTAREENSIYAQRNCQRTSRTAMTFVECNATVQDPPQQAEVKRLANEVLTPLRTGMDASQWHSQSREAEKEKTKAETSLAEVRRWKGSRASFPQEPRVEGHVLEALRSDVVSPITNASDSRDADLSLCDDEMVRVLNNGVPSGGRVRTPARLVSLLERHTVGSNGFSQSGGGGYGDGVRSSVVLEGNNLSQCAVAQES